MNGAFDIRRFPDGYYDESCYFNKPVDYLPNLNDGRYLDLYRNCHNFLPASGDWDICLGENLRMDGILASKGIPHRLDVRGEHSPHDWPLLRDMTRVCFS